jgi:DNA-binding FadR family transcriptional regulator
MKIIQALQTRDPKLAALAIEGHLSAVVQRTNIGEIERPQRSLGEILSFYADV